MGSIKEYVKTNRTWYKLYLFLQKLRHIRIIIDTPIGYFKKPATKETRISYPIDIDKDKLARETMFAIAGNNLNFLDFGGGDGKLTQLLGNEKSDIYITNYKENKIRFEQKFNYYGVDLDKKAEKIITGDVCASDYLEKNKEFHNFFDAVYSNNVFEHLNRPWVAVENIYHLLKKGGVCIIVAPFSWRYHDAPGDFFRYSHTALPFLFKSVGEVEVIKSGYDLCQRRIFNQGNGEYNDLCPTDHFGPWRETWQTVTIVKKV